MPQIRRFDHVGITVADLDAVTEFFVGLGLEVDGRAYVEGDFVDTVTGVPGTRSNIVMLRAPGGGTGGLRNVSFEVDDLQATVDRLGAEGYGLVGGIGRHEDVWLMAYVRGPEGIIVSLAERIG